MKILICTALILGLASASFAGDAPSVRTIKGVLTHEDSANIPKGPGCEFEIYVEYQMTSVAEIPQNGTTIRKYSLEATLPAANPAMSYLGKSLLLLSNYLEVICRESGKKQSQWKEINLSSLKHTVGENLGQTVQFQFSCFDR